MADLHIERTRVREPAVNSAQAANLVIAVTGATACTECKAANLAMDITDATACTECKAANLAMDITGITACTECKAANLAMDITGITACTECKAANLVMDITGITAHSGRKAAKGCTEGTVSEPAYRAAVRPIAGIVLRVAVDAADSRIARVILPFRLSNWKGPYRFEQQVWP